MYGFFPMGAVYGIDIYYIILVLPAVLVALVAQMMVKNTFSRYQSIGSIKGLTGYEVVRNMLDSNNLHSISIERVAGNLNDHYDPKKKVIRLSDSVYDSPSVAAIGVAAHEAGHALQYADGYFPIRIRSMMVPVTNIGSTLSMPLILIGLFSGVSPFIYIGIGLFSLVTVFQLITLPVEYNASNRALSTLKGLGILNENELKSSKKVLSAAALTYVASLLVSFMSLLRILLLTRERSRRR